MDKSNNVNRGIASRAFKFRVLYFFFAKGKVGDKGRRGKGSEQSDENAYIFFFFLNINHRARINLRYKNFIHDRAFTLSALPKLYFVHFKKALTKLQ